MDTDKTKYMCIGDRTSAIQIDYRKFVKPVKQIRTIRVYTSTYSN